MKKLSLLMFLFVVLMAGCTKEPREVKSPCVGIEGSPCERRSVNNSHI